jgi:hypothetical protein
MALITGPGVIVVSILTAFLSRILAEEMGAWSPSIIRSLIKFAVGRLPENQRERFEEEWQSHVNEVPGQVGKILVAVGFSMAAYDVALNDRRNQMLETQVRLLAQIVDADSAAARVLNLIQNDETVASIEGMSSRVNNIRIRSKLSKSQQFRNRLATRIATDSATSQTLVAKLSYALRAWRLAAYYARISDASKRVSEQSAEIVKLFEERVGTLDR